jgi:hypothetical protein
MGQHTNLHKKAYMPTQQRQIAAQLRAIRNTCSMLALGICFFAIYLRPAAPQCAEKVQKLKQATTEVYLSHSIAQNAPSFALAALSHQKQGNAHENKNASK